MGADIGYTGDERLVFSVDLGTTMSAVSFAHLQPGSAPRVRLVTKWPGQEDAAGDCKIPSVIRYKDGKPISYGADAVENPEALENTHLARWFKLHLHPVSMRTKNNILEIPPLPNGVSLKQVYAHFLSYLFKHAVEFFKTNSHDGGLIWDRLKDNFDLVMAIPNGWDTTQQGFLRDTVILADVLPRGHDVKRLQFVSEAEASVHFALEHSDGTRWLTPGTNFAVLDAGGSTVDTTLYRCAALQPKLALEEVTASDCVQAGAVFVDRDAEKMLRLKLKGSKFGADEYIGEMMQIFERKTKRKFDGSPEPCVVNFGRAKDNDPSRNISKGRITLSSQEIALTFQNALIDILASVERVIERSEKICDALLMVGGFSESPYLRKMLREKFAQRGVQIVSIDDGTKKAAAEGATVWYLRQSVVARASRSWYGTNMTVVYTESNSVHGERSHTTFVDPDGVKRVGPIFSVWCAKNDVVRWEQSKTFDYCRMFERLPDRELSGFEMQVYACDNDARPYWLYDSSGTKTTSHLNPGVRPVCKILGDLSGLRGTLKQLNGAHGKPYWQINYAVEIFFGQTSLCAELTWKENGITKKGPLTLVPDSIA